MNPDCDQILVADDHEVSLYLLKRQLTNWGYRVTTASDGEAALQILASAAAPSIAIIDWHMPKIDGLEVCRRVRSKQDHPYTYLVLLSARGRRDEIADGLKSGADDYVIKPFNPDELKARLKVGQRIVKLERNLEKRVRELETAIVEAKRLKGFLPICMYCKNIRDDKNYWHQIEDYIRTATGTDFAHGVCPACREKLRMGME